MFRLIYIARLVSSLYVFAFEGLNTKLCVNVSSFSTFCVVDEKETNCVGQLNKLFCFDRSSLLTSALTCEEQYLLVEDGNGSCIHLCQVKGRLKLRTISNIPGFMDIAVTDVGIVLLSSSKKHARTVQLKGRRDAWGYRNPNKSVWRNCRPS